MTSEQFLDWYADWRSSAKKVLNKAIELSEEEKATLEFVVTHSAYLRKLLIKHPDIFMSFVQRGVADCWQPIEGLLGMSHEDFASLEALSSYLRYIKQRAALLIALADINDQWDLKEVTQALSQLAEQTLEVSLKYLLSQAAKKGEITLKHPEKPTKESGIIIIGMGKLGGYELNYSSDIDIIVFYEPGKLNYQGRQNEQHFLNKITQELVKLMQDRTADGYVFRTDLRLRPDPSSMPLAVSTNAAIQYYESLGQNWERAAMIKARAIAGDMDAGNNLLKELGPYVWRKNLDFVSIQDILSIKRQISKKIGLQEDLTGHNIKLGKGGIREIEFFAQLHQLIWGGRQKELRGRRTVRTLKQLVELEHISQEDCKLLIDAYEFYRKLEHRLQMVEDQQTHTLPGNHEGLKKIAKFMGYEHFDSFEAKLQSYIVGVHHIFTESFETEGGSLHAEGNLVFTGDSHDPETLDTLRKLGFNNPQNVSKTIMDWHRGSRRCTRTKVARQMLTELVPEILKALSSAVNPDDAFIKFDKFLLALPAGIQLFSLMRNNPQIMQLIAEIMGTAPTLSQTLSRRPELIETALFSSFYQTLPSKQELLEELESELSHIQFYDAAMELLRSFKNEKHFQAGIQLLRNVAKAHEIGQYLSDLADVLIDKALSLTLDEFTAQYGVLEQGGACCIIALGKLGSQELTFGSDVDLMFVYDAPDFDAMSDGELSHSPSVYFNRLSQRIVNAISMVGSNGALYEVDTRLRPSGEQGLLAVSKQSLTQYFSKDAWTFERMALCKARAMAGDASLQQEVGLQIESILSEMRDIPTLKNDVVDMRSRVAQSYSGKSFWNLKHAAGGLMDIDFVAQYMLLATAHRFPHIKHRRSYDILNTAIRDPEITDMLDIRQDDLQTLIQALQFLTRLQHMLRLTSEKAETLDNPPAGLAEVLTGYMAQDSYNSLIETLNAIEKGCKTAYMNVMH